MLKQIQTIFILLFVVSLVFAMNKKRCTGNKRKNCELKSFNVSSLPEDHKIQCPAKYNFEEGDSLDLTSPRYPQHYPNKYNCQWKLQATGCQFNIVCNDLYTKPTCPGPTWKPLTTCEGDYLRFHSDDLQVEDSTEPVKLDQRFCWRQNVNFTFGFADTLYVQFKTDAKYKARGFNCTVVCEGFDFSQLFARIPFTEEKEDVEDYDDDYEDDLDLDYNDEDYELDE